MIHDDYQWGLAVNGLRMLRNAVVLRLLLMALSMCFAVALLMYDGRSFEAGLGLALGITTAEAVAAVMALVGAHGFASHLAAGFASSKRFVAHLPEGATASAWCAALSLLVEAAAQGWVLLIAWQMVGSHHSITAPAVVGEIASLIAMLGLLNALRLIAPALAARGLGRAAGWMMAATTVLGFAYAVATANRPRYADRSAIVTGIIGAAFAVCVMLGYVALLQRAITRMTGPAPTPLAPDDTDREA